MAITNSPQLEAYTPSLERRITARRAFGIHDNTILLVNLARMIQHKGQDTLIRLTAELTADHAIQTIIMGPDWGYRPTLEKLAQNLGGSTRLMDGSVTGGIQLLAAADICVHPSSKEGMPGALAEACAAGLPIVAYDVNGVREAVTPENGRLIKYGDYNGLKQAVQELLRRPDLRKSCGVASLRLAQEKFSGEQMTKRFEELFTEEAQNKDRLADPITTIIMPVWKRHIFLQKAIDSVLAQTSPDWRLIITVDTLDPSPEIKEILGRITDNRISIIYGPHKNQCAAINRAISAAKTEYCSRLDSDDMLAPLAVEILGQYIKANPKIGYFYSSLRVIDQNSLPLIRTGHPTVYIAEDFRPSRQEEWYIARHWITWKVRDYAIAGGMAEDIEYGEDYLLALTMMVHGTKFLPMKECLYQWRDHDEGSIQKEYSTERSRATVEEVRRRYAEMKRTLGVSWEGEDPSTIRPRTPFGRLGPISHTDDRVREYLWATADIQRRRAFVLALIKDSPKITTSEIARLFHLVCRTEDKTIVVRELTTLFSKPIEYLGVARTEQLCEALTADGWIPKNQSSL